MGIIARMFGAGEPARERTEPVFRNASPENPSTSLSSPDQWLLDWGSNGGGGTFGPAVNEQTAMRVSAVFRCVGLISGLIAGLPLKVYHESESAGRVEAKGNKLTRLLGAVPFPGRPLTSFSWREQWGVNLLLWGNHYSRIRYDNAARIAGFEPYAPWDVDVLRTKAGTNVYKVALGGGAFELVPQEDMLHFVGMGFDGIKGASFISTFARDSISLAKLEEEQTGRVHENAARPSGMVTLPSSITVDGIKRMEAHWNERNTGRANAGRVLFADRDTSYTPFQMKPEDLETLEARRYQSADIARFFGVPPHLIGEAAGTSAWGTGIEQLTIGFKQFTLEPILQRIEAELELKLLDGTPLFASFDRDALTAMDALAQAQVMQTQINSALLTPNEGRRKLKLPDVEGGDTLILNSTMIPLDRALNPPEPPAPTPAPPKESSNAK